MVRTLNELGPTTVDGLAAALSWPEKRTERLVKELAKTREGGIVFYAGSRRVEILSLPPPRPGPGLPAAPKAPAEPAPSRPAPSPSALQPKWGGRMICPSCSASMQMTAGSEAMVCASCGEISNLPRSTGGSSTGSPSLTGVSDGPVGTIPDRRLQELFAAYVTARPVICPKCKSPLRHRGLGLYGCPACGQIVQFASGERAGTMARHSA